MRTIPLRGHCRVLYCFDVARAIDLGRARAVLASARATAFQHKGGFPARAGVTPPLRVNWPTQPLGVFGTATEAQAEVAVYDFGALAITWSLPVPGDLEQFVALSSELYDHAELIARSRGLAAEVLIALGDAAERPRLHELLQDYVVFEIEPTDPQIEQFLQNERTRLARILRAESAPLSRQEISDAVDGAVSYGEQDAALVDWLAAVLIGTRTDDERLLLELATVELLELHVLDAQLDQQIETAYRVLTERRSWFSSWTTQRRQLESIACAQADDALLHEGIDNALKLFGDDYLARLYRTAARRFHFDDFDRAIQRKLGVLGDIYESLSDQAAHRRAETLEWIIIVLIAVDIVLYFTPLHTP